VEEPFQFVTASYLIRICRERAATLGELAKCIRSCSDSSIFHHTFQSLERHHYVAFSNDFAQWVLAACNEAPLAERLAAADLRDFVSIGDLRESLAVAVEEHIQQNPVAADRWAFERFYFCETVERVVQRDEQAFSLAELALGIRRSSLQTIHYHFINSRLRLHLQTNDFSYWIRKSLEIPALAQRLDQIDIYMNTLEDIRQELLEILERWK
jgi:Family of unknown function (DUF5752)